jgi:hypothetical protein
MRKHFFRPFIADPVCASSVAIPVTAVVRDDGLIRLDWDGQSAELWNHRPDDVDAALRSTHGLAEWAPEWQVLFVPGVAVADERTAFTLAYLDERTECTTDSALLDGVVSGVVDVR